MKVVKEVKSCPVDQMVSCGLVFSPKKDGRGKNTLKALRYTSVITTILGESEEIQNLGCTLEADCPALLPKGKCRNPDGNQAVLTER